MPADNKPNRSLVLVSLLFCLPSVIWFMLAFYVSWPLGPKYVDEGGVTQLRFAVAMLAMGLALALSFFAPLLLVILNRLARLQEEVGQARQQPTERSESLVKP